MTQTVSFRLHPEKLNQFLGTAVEIMGADRGTLQFYDADEDVLTIMAHIGFNEEFLSHFRAVKPGMACCGMALKRRQRVVIEDVDSDPTFAHLRETFRRYGYSAVQSTPLLDENGEIFGVISTHYRRPTFADEQKLFILDQYLLQAAPLISRMRRD